ncbi:hypothetical protein OAG79_03065 [Akkermansiaceae bacterium]|nr:hypothetical protein [Akkermansiaceae bacterium]MDB4311580.1 hypothetical protein [bacterium]MDB4417277.1 hypothetical protein [Akkermansiaceae bacterium]MDB4620252.1 hypothetical protein [Akkermansiaceae bacterium]MDB4691981.1 hypothetical protein [Akkermansiaceae bacterium]
MLDEGHAHWVKDYWGEDYLEDPNCFYRMRYIGCLSSHYQLTGDESHLPLLREVTEDLVDDFDNSPHGLFDDYPNQCFPADVVCAIAMIRRADLALGIDRGDLAKNTLHRVMGNFNNGLPLYTASEHTGWAATPSRGCTNGFFFAFVGKIDEELGRSLYKKYCDDFWQENFFTKGWREFRRGPDDEGFYYDPDSGPVISDIGCAATGLGLGAARFFGDSKRTSALSTQLLASATPLPSGRLLIPSLVADHEHAPLFPEIVMLHQLSISSEGGETATSIPLITWILWLLQGFLAFVFLRWSWRLVKRS